MNKQEQELNPAGATRKRTGPIQAGERPPLKDDDLVLDLSGIGELGVSTLSLLITAQQQAEQEDRTVWLVGVPLHVWKALHAMGLKRLFKAFPASREAIV